MRIASRKVLFFLVFPAGGSGKRFRPSSCWSQPRLLLTLGYTGRSLLQSTANRLSVVGGSQYRSQVLEQLPEMPAARRLDTRLERFA